MRFIMLYSQLCCSEIRRKLLFIEVHSLVKFQFSLLKLVNALITSLLIDWLLLTDFI